jgi:hypothetical protein
MGSIMKPFKTVRDVKTKPLQALNRIKELEAQTKLIPHLTGIKIYPMQQMVLEGVSIANATPNAIYLGINQASKELMYVLKAADKANKPAKKAVKRKNGF